MSIAKFTKQYALHIVIIFFILTIVSLFYTVTNLGVDTNTEEMISPNLAWRQDYIKYKKLFPKNINNIIIKVAGNTPEETGIATKKLMQELSQHPKLFTDIYSPMAGDFFANNGLLYLNLEELNNLQQHLTQLSPMLLSLQRNWNLNTFLEIVSQSRDPNLMAILNQGVKNLEEKKVKISWAKFFNIDSKNQQLIFVKPAIDYSRLLPGERAITKIKQLAEDVELTGQVTLAYEEFKTVTQGAIIAGILSLLMVAIILYWTFKSIKLVMAAITALITGLILTAAFATLAIGRLNMISVAFAVLYIGLGIDFSIHLCARYRELLIKNLKPSKALAQAIKDKSISLLFCALTTCIGFYAFLPTTFKGVSELGLISGTGMVISLIVNLLFLPALLNLCSIKVVTDKSKNKNIIKDIWLKQIKNYKIIIILAIGLAMLGLWYAPKVKFIADPMHLRSIEQPSVKVFRELSASGVLPATVINVIADNEKAVSELKQKLKVEPTVKQVIAIDDFVPQQQTAKLAIINKFKHLFKQNIIKQNLNIQLASKNLKNLNISLPNTDTDNDTAIINLEKIILDNLYINLINLQQLVKAKVFTRKDLPKNLLEHWISSGKYKLTVFPKQNLANSSNIKPFVTAVLKVAPHATGLPVVHEFAGQAIVTAFQQAVACALIAISVLLLFLFRSFRDASYVLLPLLLAGLLIGTVSVVFDIPFNFANIIALPLLLGLGVDNGIHLVHFFRHQGEYKSELKEASITRAIIGSTFTTICSFGNLTFSPHPGMASMGQLLAIGMVLVLLATLYVLPALINCEQTFKR